MITSRAAPEVLPDAAERAAARGRDPERRARNLAARAVLRSPTPGNDVAPVIEVEMGDHDRVDLRPALLLPEPRQHSGPAIEEQPARSFDEVARLRAARIGPGGRA